jgi:hypothetical protein
MSETKSVNGKKVVVYYVPFPTEVKGSQVNIHGESTKKVIEEFKKNFSMFSGYEDVIEVFLPTFGETKLETIQF